jgi:putative membrane protein
MGGMMGPGIGAWSFLWILLGLAAAAAVVVGGVLAARAAGPRRGPEPPPIPPGDSPAVREAKDTLKLRYAHGEISREEYLQGKVELED